MSWTRPRDRSGERYSGVPYAREDRKAGDAVTGRLRSYLSAKPKSTKVGTLSTERRMFAGLLRGRRSVLAALHQR